MISFRFRRRRRECAQRTAPEYQVPLLEAESGWFAALSRREAGAQLSRQRHCRLVEQAGAYKLATECRKQRVARANPLLLALWAKAGVADHHLVVIWLRSPPPEPLPFDSNQRPESWPAGPARAHAAAMMDRRHSLAERAFNGLATCAHWKEISWRAERVGVSARVSGPKWSALGAASGQLSLIFLFRSPPRRQGSAGQRRASGLIAAHKCQRDRGMSFRCGRMEFLCLQSDSSHWAPAQLAR